MIEQILKGVSKLTASAEQVLPDVTVLKFTIVNACMAGDGDTTTKQESLSSVLTQTEQVKGPPAYFTTDWESARRSVERLKALEPDLAVVSHGNPMRGDELRRHLEYLVSNFNKAAVPERGRYSGTVD